MKRKYKIVTNLKAPFCTRTITNSWKEIEAEKKHAIGLNRTYIITNRITAEVIETTELKCKYYDDCEHSDNLSMTCTKNGGGGYCSEYKRREGDLKQ